MPRVSLQANFDYVNKYIGNKIKIKRIELGLTQTELGKHLDVSFQQIQKYENGKNKVPVDKIRKLCDIFSCTLEYLFPENEKSAKLKAAERKDKEGFDFENMDSTEMATIAKLMLKKSPETRKQALKAVKAVLSSFDDL